MVILHIGKITDNSASGVAVSVPLHARHQSRHAQVALFNLYDYTPKNAHSNYVVFKYNDHPNVLKSILGPFNRPDIVVFHEIYHAAFRKISSTLRKASIPYIIVPHGCLTSQAQNIKKYKKIIGNAAYFKGFINGALAIQYLSSLEHSNTILRKHKYFIRGNGSQISSSKKHTFSERGLKIIYLGRLDYKIKGLDILLEAVNSIKTNLRQWGVTLTLCGPVSERDLNIMREKIKQNGLGGLVKIEPAVFGRAKVKKLLQYDYFIQTSRSEGQPLGLVEAMGLGLPCIVSEGTGFYEIIGNEKIGFAARTDSSSVAKAITCAYEDRELLKIKSERASNYISTHYKWDYISRLTVLDYIRLADKSRI